LLSQGDAAGLHAGSLVAETFHGDAAGVLTIGDASSRRLAGLQLATIGDAAGLDAGKLVAETFHGDAAGVLTIGDASSRRPGLQLATIGDAAGPARWFALPGRRGGRRREGGRFSKRGCSCRPPRQRAYNSAQF
jgi:hypothetical protein